MDNLEQLKNMWQQQSTPATPALSSNSSTQLVEQLQAYQRKTQKETRWLTFNLVATHVVLFGTFAIMQTWKYIVGVTLIVIAMDFMLVLVWKNQLSSREVDFNQQGTQFVSSILRKLKGRRKISSRFMPLYSLLLLVGLNLGWLDIFPLMELTPLQQLLIQGAMTLLLGVGTFFGIKGFLKKFDAEVNPMIEELDAVERDWMV
ncbi:MAG: hypothetical protein AAFO94_20020 [Bacteroidota bacterium]